MAKDASRPQTQFWCLRPLRVTVRGPDDERHVIHVAKPYARIGGHPECEVVLPGANVPPVCLYLHATREGIFCLGLESMREDGMAPNGWLRPQVKARVGPFRISAAFADSGPDPIDCVYDPRSKQSVRGHAPQLRIQVRTSGRSPIVKTWRRQLAVLGRQRPSHLRLDHPTVSRTHCVLYWDGQRLWTVDLLSGNGVCINGDRVESGLIAPGERLELGQIQVCYVASTQEIQLGWEEGDLSASPFEEDLKGAAGASAEVAPDDLDLSGWQPGVDAVPDLSQGADSQAAVTLEKVGLPFSSLSVDEPLSISPLVVQPPADQQRPTEAPPTEPPAALPFSPGEIDIQAAGWSAAQAELSRLREELATERAERSRQLTELTAELAERLRQAESESARALDDLQGEIETWLEDRDALQDKVCRLEEQLSAAEWQEREQAADLARAQEDALHLASELQATQRELAAAKQKAADEHGAVNAQAAEQLLNGARQLSELQSELTQAVAARAERDLQAIAERANWEAKLRSAEDQCAATQREMEAREQHWQREAVQWQDRIEGVERLGLGAADENRQRTEELRNRTDELIQRLAAAEAEQARLQAALDERDQSSESARVAAQQREQDLEIRRREMQAGLDEYSARALEAEAGREAVARERDRIHERNAALEQQFAQISADLVEARAEQSSRETLWGEERQQLQARAEQAIETVRAELNSERSRQELNLRAELAAEQTQIARLEDRQQKLELQLRDTADQFAAAREAQTVLEREREQLQERCEQLQGERASAALAHAEALRLEREQARAVIGTAGEESLHERERMREQYEQVLQERDNLLVLRDQQSIDLAAAQESSAAAIEAMAASRAAWQADRDGLAAELLAANERQAGLEAERDRAIAAVQAERSERERQSLELESQLAVATRQAQDQADQWMALSADHERELARLHEQLQHVQAQVARVDDDYRRQQQAWREEKAELEDRTRRQELAIAESEQRYASLEADHETLAQDRLNQHYKLEDLEREIARLQELLLSESERAEAAPDTVEIADPAGAGKDLTETRDLDGPSAIAAPAAEATEAKEVKLARAEMERLSQDLSGAREHLARLSAQLELQQQERDRESRLWQAERDAQRDRERHLQEQVATFEQQRLELERQRLGLERQQDQQSKLEAAARESLARQISDQQRTFALRLTEVREAAARRVAAELEDRQSLLKEWTARESDLRRQIAELQRVAEKVRVEVPPSAPAPTHAPGHSRKRQNIVDTRPLE